MIIIPLIEFPYFYFSKSVWPMMSLKNQRLVQSVIIRFPKHISHSLPHLEDNSDKHILKPPPPPSTNPPYK